MHDPHQYDNEDDGEKDGEGGEERGLGLGLIFSVFVRSVSDHFQFSAIRCMMSWPVYAGLSHCQG